MSIDANLISGVNFEANRAQIAYEQELAAAIEASVQAASPPGIKKSCMQVALPVLQKAEPEKVPSPSSSQAVVVEGEERYQKFKKFTHIPIADLTYEQFDEIRALKKWAKKPENRAADEADFILKEYETFIQDNLFLRTLREMSRGMRAIKSEDELRATFPWGWGRSTNQSLSDQWIAYQHLVRELGGVEEMYRSMKADKAKWYELRKRLFNAHKELLTKAPEMFKKPLVWIHGTVSSTLPALFHMKIKKDAPPALIPSGMLLRHNFAPLAGELTWGIGNSGINNVALSGVIPGCLDRALRYAKPEVPFDVKNELKSALGIQFADYYTPVIKLKIYLLRLCLMNAPAEIKNEAREHLKKQCAAARKEGDFVEDWQKAAVLLGHKRSEFGELEKGARVQPGSAVFTAGTEGESTLAIVVSVDTAVNGKRMCRLLIDDAHATKYVEEEAIEAVCAADIQARAEKLEKKSPDKLLAIWRSMINLRKRKAHWQEAISLLTIQKSRLPATTVPVGEEQERVAVGSVVFTKRSSGEPTLGIVIARCEKNEKCDQVQYLVHVDTDDSYKIVEESFLSPVSSEYLKAINGTYPAADIAKTDLMIEKMYSIYETLEELRLLVDCIEPLQLNEEELALIKGSFSMLAASTTIAQFTYVRSGIEGERAASGPQFLGKDIQLLFTPQEHVQRVEAYLKSKNEQIAQKMHVLSMDAAHVLTGMS